MLRPSRLPIPNAVTFLSAARVLPSQTPTEAAYGSRPETAVARLRTARRRIWELGPTRVALIVGGLLGRDEVLSLLSTETGFDAEADVVLWRQVVRACSSRCLLAEEVEAELHQRSGWLAAMVEGRPMIEIADWWLHHREDLTGAQIASLLWRLSCDPRPLLEKLASRIADDLCTRAVQLVRDDRPCADARVPGGAEATAHEQSPV